MLSVNFDYNKPSLRGVAVAVAYDCGCSNTLLLLTRIDKIGQLEISSI